MSTALIISLVVGLILTVFYLAWMRKGQKTNEDLAKNMTESMKGYFKILTFFDRFLKEKDKVKKKEYFEKIRELLYEYNKKFPSSSYKKEILKIESKLVEYMNEEGIE